jgi:hypothetical protein
LKLQKLVKKIEGILGVKVIEKLNVVPKGKPRDHALTNGASIRIRSC